MTPEELALLDRFACAAMQSMATDEYYNGHMEVAAEDAYKFAEAMIVERRKRRRAANPYIDPGMVGEP